MSRSPFPFIKASVLIALATVAIAAQAVPGNVKNGSFESPAIDSGYKTFGPGEAIGAWTVIGEGHVAVVHRTYTDPPLSFPAHRRFQWLDLTGAGSNSVTGVTQTFKTVKGGTYRLRFAVGNIFDDRQPPMKVYGEVSTVKLLIDDELKFTAVNGSWSTAQLAWNQFKVSFIAKGSTTKITFMNADPSDDNSNALDSVVLTRVSK